MSSTNGQNGNTSGEVPAGAGFAKRYISAEEWAKMELHASGIPYTDKYNMGIHLEVASEESPLEGLMYYYYDVDNNPMSYINASGIDQPYCRIKHRNPLVNDQGKPLKYTQPIGSPQRLYFPPWYPNCGRKKWSDIATDTTINIYFMEGEKKAICANLNGLVTIGLAGVYGFIDARQTDNIVVDFKEIRWQDRTVWLTFDSDILDNYNIAQAQHQLMLLLLSYGADVRLKHVPDIGGDHKMGFDDYIMTDGYDVSSFLSADEQYANETKVAAAMRKSLAFLGENPIPVAYDGSFKHSDKGINLTYSKLPVSKDAPVTARHQQHHKLQYTIKGSAMGAGAVSDKHKPLKPPKPYPPFNFTVYAGLPKYTHIMYDPLTRTGATEEGAYNLFKAFEPQGVVQPVESVASTELLTPDEVMAYGDAPKYFRRFLKATLGHLPTHEVQRLLDWASFPFQKNMIKTSAAVVLYSETTGTGKSFLARVFRMMHGHNGVVDTLDNLRKSHSEQFNKSTFAEISEPNERFKNSGLDEFLKAKITDEYTIINPKYKSEIKIRNSVNILMTTNDLVKVPIQLNDRRFIVIHFIERKLPEEIKLELHAALAEENNIATLYHWFLNRRTKLDLSLSFVPDLATPIKSRMAQAQLPALVYHAYELKHSPKNVLAQAPIKVMPGAGDWRTSKELYAMFTGSTNTQATSYQAWLRVLAGGCIQPYSVMATNGEILYLVKNHEYWLTEQGVLQEAHTPDSVSLAYTQRFGGLGASVTSAEPQTLSDTVDLVDDIAKRIKSKGESVAVYYLTQYRLGLANDINDCLIKVTLEELSALLPTDRKLVESKLITLKKHASHLQSDVSLTGTTATPEVLKQYIRNLNKLTKG